MAKPERERETARNRMTTLLLPKHRKYFFRTDTYLAVDNSAVHLQHPSPYMRVCVMNVLLKCVKETISICSATIVQLIAN